MLGLGLLLAVVLTRSLLCEGFSFPHGHGNLAKHASLSSRLQNKFSLSQTPMDRSSLKGEDLVPFTLESQDINKWKEFFIAVGGVLGSLFYIWLYPNGPQLGGSFVRGMENIANGDSTLTITYMLFIFAVIHSGLASLRPYAEEVVGPKVWRYVFAYAS